MRHHLLAILLAIPLVLVHCATATAQIYQSSFDATQGFNPGVLADQQGWLAGSGAALAFEVTDQFARTGTQSVLIRHPASGPGPTIHSVARQWDQAGLPWFEMSGWFYMDGAQSTSGRYVGMQMASGANAGTVLAGIAIDGSGALRAATAYGQLLGPSGIIETNRRNDFIDRWVQLSVLADITTGDVTFTFNNLGTSAGSSMVSTTLNRDFANFSHISLVNDWSTASAATTRVFFDDFTAQAIPEPGTTGLLAMLAIGGLLLRRRRHKTSRD